MGASGHKYEDPNPKEINTTPKIRRDIKNNSHPDDSIPNDQYLCPFCDEIPELVNIHTDNGTVVFKCRCKLNEEQIVPIDRYFKILSDSNTYFKSVCCICNKLQKNYRKKEVFQYCYVCKKDYCNECFQKVENHPKSHFNQWIPINSKNTRCLEHYKEGPYTSFCLDCHLNVCNEYSTKIHREHKKISFFKIEPKKKIILEKNRILANIIKFNELILNTYESFPDNYFHNINVANLAESIIAENSREPKVLENAFKNLEANIKIRNKAIEEFNKKFKMSLKGNEEELSLQNIGLKDSDFRLLSKINFSNLKDLNLSYNQIKDISSIKNLETSNLKYLNFNHNNIEDIGVLESLNLTSLIELQLQNNNLKSVSSLLNSEMPSLKLLRIEGNNDLDRSLNDFKKVIKKFTKQIIYVVKTYEDFNKKYDVKISEESKDIDLRDSRKGNDILKDLYLLNSNYDKLSSLYLYNCEIDDITLLSRISFKNLEILDLSDNNIKNIEILAKLKCKKLVQLYLDDNKISYITPLKYMKSLKIVSIKNNKIIPNDKEVENLKEEFKKRGGAINFK